jgi:L-ascorbate metabolism protein UlaG (beta-lactamase superfamily)
MREPLRLTWLGQAGFVLETSEARILIDPWFTEHERRERQSPRLADLPLAIDWLLATHEHSDHLDLPALPALHRHYPHLQIAVPSPLVRQVAEVVPAATVIGVQPGNVLASGDLTIRVVRAWHGVTVEDGYSDGYRLTTPGVTPFCGYVISTPDATVYHAGDTILGEGMVDELRGLGINVALLPVNGRDALRERQGILGNLDVTEALDLAAGIGARTLVPMHFDMVRGNTVSPAAILAGIDRKLPVVRIPERDSALTAKHLS